MNPINISKIFEVQRFESQKARTSEVIDALVLDLKECTGCNIHFSAQKLTKIAYRHPFHPDRVLDGMFCDYCKEDDKFKQLFVYGSNLL